MRNRVKGRDVSVRLGHADVLRLFRVVVFTLLAGCGTVPFDFPKEDSRAIPPNDTTRLGQAIAARSSHANESSFYGLTDGLDALGARLRELTENRSESP